MFKWTRAIKYVSRVPVIKSTQSLPLASMRIIALQSAFFIYPSKTHKHTHKYANFPSSSTQRDFETRVKVETRFAARGRESKQEGRQANKHGRQQSVEDVSRTQTGGGGL